MMNKRFNLVLGAVVASVLYACVPAKKLSDSQAESAALRAQLDRNEEVGKKEINDLRTDLENMRKEKYDLESDTIRLSSELARMRGENARLKGISEEIEAQFKNALSGADVERGKILKTLESYKLALQKKEDSLAVLSRSMMEREKDLRKLNDALAQREERMKELEDLIRQKDAAIDKIKSSLDNLLNEFKDKGLSIEQKEGRIYVRLAASLLFPSGSTEIEEAGKYAVIQVAKALQNEKDINILVEGHTDSSPLKSPNIPRNNWELSVLRATSVAQLMLEKSKILPSILTAAGRADNVVIDPNNKARNRRIEIIIIPNLDKVFDALIN
jgi:chemotaxis protein MotB